MVVDLFIRTYHKDLPWLAHSLRSIHKHVTGHRRVIIAIPQGQGNLLGHLTAETVIEVPDLPNGYLGQQLTKMEAWKYTDADAILYWDSDTVATVPFDIMAEMTSNGRPIVYCTPYEQVGDAQCWQQATIYAMGFHVGLEYMRRLPLLYLRSTVIGCGVHVMRTTGHQIGDYMTKMGRFSEFNALGAFAHRFNEEQYLFLNTEHHAPPPNKVRQFWSWGGITADVQAELDKL